MNLGGWTILGVLAVIAIIFFNKKGTIWGGLAAGIVVGAIISVVYVLKDYPFQWNVIMKSAIVGALLGGVIEWGISFARQRKGG